MYNGCFGKPKRATVTAFKRITGIRDVKVAWSRVTSGQLKRTRAVVTARELCLLALSNNDFALFTKILRGYPLRRAQHYTTMHGPIFWGNWEIYEDTALNLDKALTRMSNSRVDEKTLVRNQHKFLRGRGANRVVRAALTQVRDRMRPILAALADVWTEQKAYSEQIHPKRKIRIQAMREIIESASGDTMFTSYIRGKLKLFERAKPGKYPRLIGDYTCPGSLLAGFLAEIAKKSFGTFTMANFHSEFCKNSEATRLDAVGDRLYRDNGDQHYHFSDDSVFKINGKLFELDISSCDMSNHEGVFEAVEFLFSEFPQFLDAMRKNIAQCKNPLRMNDPGCRHNKVTLIPIRPMEFSGTTLTTLLNIVASLSIGISMHIRGAKTVDEITSAAFAAGYTVTVAERATMEEMQFLKHSWHVNAMDKVCSFLNLGPMFRSFGSCLGDYPGRGNLSARVDLWNRAVVSGYCHSGRSAILQCLQDIFPPLREVKFRLPDEVVKHFSESPRVEKLENICFERRYKVSGACIEHFLHILKHASTSGWMTHPFVTAVYAADYGL